MIILGIDYGLKKVGLAIADTQVGLAEPIVVIPPNEVIYWINKNLPHYHFDQVVLGLTQGGLDKHTRALARDIRESCGLPVKYVDETLSTQDAHLRLKNNRAGRTKIRKIEDAVASAIMLQSYLEGGEND